MAKKSLQPEGVTRKSEIDALFARLSALYAPWPSPGRYPPWNIVIARARVWRRQRSPDGKRLAEGIEQLAGRGLAREGVWFLIGLCESSFRSLRAVEYALEHLFPDFLDTGSNPWPPSAAARELLNSAFRQLWKEKEKTDGKAWWLAAGPLPLPIWHRPGLIAPWVTGVTVKRWLLLDKVPQDAAEALALQLVDALLDQKIRSDELRHWQDLLGKVSVPIDGRQQPLPAHLIDQVRSYVLQQIPIDLLSPTEFLTGFPIPLSACDQFRQILQRAWTPASLRPRGAATQTIPPQARRISEPFTDPSHSELDRTGDASLDREVMFACSLCTEQVGPMEILDHLWDEHGVPKDHIDVQTGHKQIRRTITGQILATWSKK